MKNLQILFLAIVLACTTTSFASTSNDIPATNPKEDSCIRALENFVDGVEYGYSRYKNTDWERTIRKYSEFDSPGFNNYINSLSPEKIKKVRKLKSRCSSIISNKYDGNFGKKGGV
ncbi:MAG: hypothetical protein ACI94Y_002817 [Maribacter sp.]|jgi:hypothetical protein